MSQKIVFTEVAGLGFFPPKPAIKSIPDWYIKTPEYTNGERKILKKGTPHTIKKCIPVFDAMTAGYILYTEVEVSVTHENGAPYFMWPLGEPIGFHPIIQAPLHPNKTEFPYPKWNNNYSIKTPKGYSSLFVPPMHNPNKFFTILPGIVDTDTYTAPVNFPFVMNDLSWTGIIPAGTPIAQVIPFKRESWKIKEGLTKDIEEQNFITKKLNSFFLNSYKKQFWNRKEYN
jgi:hypothetical protein